MKKNFFIVCCIALFLESPLYAGMPAIRLGYLSSLRVEALSFFLFIFLVATWIFKSLWNKVLIEIVNLPKVTYKRALGIMILWAMVFNLILTMISGARELMTPGAWVSQGATYRLKSSISDITQRKVHIEALSTALVEYAKKHENTFPLNNYSNAISQDLWKMPGNKERYHYITGVLLDQEKKWILLYEPATVGSRRYVMFSDGSIKRLLIREIEQILRQELSAHNKKKAEEND
ncbi:hypothetical protein [Candidatus Uabimicrobium sp. HlEnr_7]|uniref:hypothetical protein n=1 Tax=Candidatus Uabimicrobium helgolandensis TaxID=3095367 RepID=UPI003555D434